MPLSHFLPMIAHSFSIGDSACCPAKVSFGSVTFPFSQTTIHEARSSLRRSACTHLPHRSKFHGWLLKERKKVLASDCAKIGMWMEPEFGNRWIPSHSQDPSCIYFMAYGRLFFITQFISGFSDKTNKPFWSWTRMYGGSYLRFIFSVIGSTKSSNDCRFAIMIA